MVRRVLLLLCLSLGARADSPITSTVFWQAYQDIPAVVRAHDTQTLDEECYAFLMAAHPIDEKAAVMNALSWESPVRPCNFVFLEDKLVAKYKTDSKHLLDKLTGEEAFCLGYQTALDSFSSPSFGLRYLHKARREMPHSFTVAMITAIVESQEVYDKWEKIWPIVVKPTRKKDLVMDMRPAAKEAIFSYLSLYEEYAR